MAQTGVLRRQATVEIVEVGRMAKEEGWWTRFVTRRTDTTINKDSGGHRVRLVRAGYHETGSRTGYGNDQQDTRLIGVFVR